MASRKIVVKSLNHTVLNFELITEKPLWFIVFCLLLGALYAWLLYRNDGKLKSISSTLVKGLIVLRFTVVSLLAFLLLSPLIKTVTRTIEKPLIIIAQDASQSILIGKDSGFYKSEFPKKLIELQNRLSQKFDVRSFNFGKDVNNGFDFTYPQKQTDYTQLFDKISAGFDNRNLGAVVIATDGIYNSGSSMIYESEKFKVPFYSIALGDTSARKDILISKVKHNKTAFVGNSYPIEITIEAMQFTGAQTQLDVMLDSNIIYSKNININNNNFRQNIPVYIEAKTKGVQHLKLRLSTLAEELSQSNNGTDVFVEVLERKLKVLILALAPHPDIRILKDAIASSQNYDVAVNYISDYDGGAENYNLVILHQLPAAGNKNVLSEIYKSDIPIWTIIGSQTDVATINAAQLGINITAANGKLQAVQASVDKNFSLFTWSAEMQDVIENWPPLNLPFGIYKTTADGHVALTQRVGNVFSSQPLLIFSNINKKTAILCGEGIWRWGLKDYASKNTHALSQEFVLKTVQYLATPENKSPFKVKHKSALYENEAVVFDAELLNQAGEMININDVKLELTGNEKTYNYTLSKTNKAYTLQAGFFPVGSYKVKATTFLGDKNYTYNGAFTIAPLQAELSVSIANHNMLHTLATRSGGGTVYPSNLDSIATWIEARPEITSTAYMHKELKDLINEKWVFVLLIMLLSVEWFTRKYAGAY